MLPELIDSHCHLNYDYAPKSAEDLLREARESGVSALVTVGTDIVSLPVIRALSEKHPEIYHTVGVHPHEAATLEPSQLAILEEGARHPRCRAVGEIGLDYHYNHSPRDVQIRALEQQLGIALATGQPVVIHAREGASTAGASAEADLLQAFAAHVKRLPAGAIPGVIHCFTGTRRFGEACLDLGFYISFSGILTFKTAEDLRESARAFPLERLLVETDSPYLAPIPYRGKKCEPSMVRMTAQKLAEAKGLPIEEIARATTANARRVFRIA